MENMDIHKAPHGVKELVSGSSMISEFYFRGPFAVGMVPNTLWES